MQYIKKVPVAALILALVSVGAYAATSTLQSDQNDATAIMGVKITLKQAIDTAESNIKGIASQAEFEQSKQGPIYVIKVAQGKQIADVKVDANTGAVVSSKADSNDNHDSEDADD